MQHSCGSESVEWFLFRTAQCGCEILSTHVAACFLYILGLLSEVSFNAQSSCES